MRTHWSGAGSHDARMSRHPRPLCHLLGRIQVCRRHADLTGVLSRPVRSSSPTPAAQSTPIPARVSHGSAGRPAARPKSSAVPVSRFPSMIPIPHVDETTTAPHILLPNRIHATAHVASSRCCGPPPGCRWRRPAYDEETGWSWTTRGVRAVLVTAPQLSPHRVTTRRGGSAFRRSRAVGRRLCAGRVGGRQGFVRC